MDTNLVLLWLVVAACVLNAKPAIQLARAGRPSYLILFAAILTVAGVGHALRFAATGAVCALLFALLVVLPGLIQRRLWRLSGAQRYQAALPYARLLALLHPASGFPQLPALLRALAAAQRGALAEAEAQLEALANGPSSPTRSDAISHLCRIRGDFHAYLARTAHVPDAALGYDLGALSGRLRALGETGQLDALVALYALHAERLRATNAQSVRAYTQLFLFAFTGRWVVVDRLLRDALSQLPPAMAEYWRATCAYAAGGSADARARFEQLLRDPTAEIARAAQHRLAFPPCNARETLSPASQLLLDQLELEQAHELRYGDQARLRHAPVTRALLTVNLCVFALEELSGGSEDGATLYRLGAAVTGMLSVPEAYRLLTALFLHFGALHLALNMLNLALIGPFVESSLGKLRTAGLYLASGLVGSLLVSLIPRAEPGLFLGASGCIMGLLGATAGILREGQRRARSQTAQHRLRRLMLPLALQLAFDLTVPGISLTAHWSGMLVGFVLGTAFAKGRAVSS